MFYIPTLCLPKQFLRIIWSLAALLSLSRTALAQTKLALVSGVEKYGKDGFENLNFAEDDALELKIELEKLGFKTEVIVGQDASLAGLNRALTSLYTSSKKLKKEDVVLVFLSGHGVQKLVRRTKDGKVVEKEEPFFCPFDAHKNDISTLLNMNDLFDRLREDSGSSNNIILLDACRESSDKSGKGIDGSTIENLPNKLALFFAAQSGRLSYESPKLKHGIFTHYLLEGMRGAAADRDDELTLQGLTNYVSKRVQLDSPALLDVGQLEAQQPNLMGNLRGSLLLGKVQKTKNFPAGTIQDENVLKMQFSFCPRDGAVSSGFWIGTTEVTQRQFHEIVGSAPWDEYGDETEFKKDDQCPAVYITLDEAKHFCEALTNVERKNGRLAQTEVYRLPTTDEWRLAASYGIEGAKLEDLAWFSQNSLDRNENYAHKVASKRSNGLGLFDIQGNVWEWCLEEFRDDPQIGLVCGGGWNSTTDECSVVSKIPFRRDNRDSSVGFRVCKASLGR